MGEDFQSHVANEKGPLEEVKVPYTQEKSKINRRNYMFYKIQPSISISDIESQQEHQNSFSDSEYDQKIQNTQLKLQNAEWIFFCLDKLEPYDQIQLNEFLEVDLNFNFKKIWEILSTKLKTPECQEESNIKIQNIEELELNSEILETAVLKELSQMVFTCIKSRQSLQELCNEFYIEFKHTITQRELFLIVFRNCEPRLRELLTVAMSEYSPIPFLLSCQEMDEDKVTKSFNFPSREVFYSLFKSIPILSLSSQEESFHHRRTKLDILSYIFKTSFQYKIDKRVPGKKFQNLVSCEIQFDYYYSMPQFLCFLAPCRTLESVTLQRLIEVSNVVFLHWDSKDERIFALKYLREKAIQRKLKVVTFIENQEISSLKQTLVQEGGHTFLEIQHPDFTQVEIRQFLEQEIRRVVTQYLFKDGALTIEQEVFMERESEVAKLYGRSFINFCKLFSIETIDLQKADNVVSKLFKQVILFQGDYRNERLFPLQLQHERLIELENELNNCDNTEKRENLLQQRELMIEIMGTAQLAKTMTALIEASQMSNFGSIVRLFVKQLKYFIAPFVIQIQKCIINTQRKVKLKEITQKQGRQMLNRLEQQMNSEQLSWDILIREVKRVIEFHQKSMSAQYAGVVSKLIEVGESFQIVQGECLRILFDKTIRCLGNLATKKTLVVAIVGEQSSGKSTLLNYVWGTQYATSAGRCTKGIYGAVLPLKQNDQFDQILLLDTEGIQSIERKDDLFFDRCLCLFLLCVSHLVIINNEGNFREAMKNTVQITLSCWEDLQVQRVNNPSLFFVLNKLSSINPNELAEHIEKLNDQLEGGEALKKLVNSENFQFLPHAFQGTELHLKDKKQQELKQLIRGETNIETKLIRKQFLDAVAKLKSAILNTISGQSTKSSHSFTLQEWFNFAKGTWETIRNHKKLVSYSDLREKLDDQLLEEKIQSISKEKFCSEEARARFEAVTMDLINALHKSKKSGQRVERIDEEMAEIKFKKEFEILYCSAEEQFNEFSQNLSVAPRIVIQRRNLLHNQCMTYYLTYLEKERKKISLQNTQLQYSKSYGKKLIKKAQDLKRSYNFKTNQEAIPFFEKEWNDIIEELDKEVLRQNKAQGQKLYNSVRQFYRAKAGGRLPEANKYFLILKQSTTKQRQKIQFVNFFQKQEFTSVYFDQQLWLNNGTINKQQKTDQIQKLLYQNDSIAFFQLKDFFTAKQVHFYSNWSKCWRSQNAEEEFKKYQLQCSGCKEAEQRKIILQQFTQCLNNQAKSFGLILSDYFKKHVIAAATKKLLRDRFSQYIIVRDCLTKTFKQEGKLFAKLKKESPLIKQNRNFKYFTQQINYEQQEKKKINQFESTYLGIRKLITPLMVKQKALEQFLINILNKEYTKFGDDQIKQAMEFISEKIRWATITHRVDVELRKKLTVLEIQRDQEEISIEEFIDQVFKEKKKIPQLNPSAELINIVSEVVNQTIELVNQTLHLIFFRLHQNTIGLLHVYAMTQTWVYLNHIAKLKLRQKQLESLGSREFWKEYFLSVLLEKSQDKSYAHMFVKEIVQKTREEVLVKSKDQFKFNSLQTLNNQGERRLLIHQLDQKYFNGNQDNLTEKKQYIMSPAKVIESHFERILKQYTAQHLQTAKKLAHQDFAVRTLKILKSMLASFLSFLPKSVEENKSYFLFELLPSYENQESLKNFFNSNFKDIPPSRLHRHFGSAASLFLIDYLTLGLEPEIFKVKAMVDISGAQDNKSQLEIEDDKEEYKESKTVKAQRGKGKFLRLRKQSRELTLQFRSRIKVQKNQFKL